MVSKPDFLSSYGRLERILKDIALRLKLIITLEFLIRLASVFLIVVLGNLFVQEAGAGFPYLPFVYSVLSLGCLIFVLVQGLRATASRQSLQQVAGGLEQKFPELKDDVTNAFLLFHQIRKRPSPDRLSAGLVQAHLQKTVDTVSRIRPSQAVSFKKSLSSLKLFLPLCIAFFVVITLNPHFFYRTAALIFRPLSALPARETFIALEKTPAIVLRGTSLTVRAKTSGYIPENLMLRLWPEAGEEISFPMKSEAKGSFSYLISSAQTSFRFRAESEHAGSVVHRVRVVAAPDISGLQLTLIPPGYTGLPKEVISGGHIEALKGTVVDLEAQATKAVREGRLILNRRSQLPLKVEAGQLRGNLLVFHPGVYSIIIRDDFGFENANPVEYGIRLIPDKYPESEIISPPEDIEVSGNEVIPISYSVRDDFGVTAVRLVFQLGGLQRSITLKSLKDKRPESTSRYDWDLTALALTPGDRVSYRLEVWDNDTISGPKAGYSKTYTLHTRDEKDRIAREAERVQGITEALLDLLADQLEESKDRNALSDDISKIMENVDQYLERMGMEKIERYDLESLKRNLLTLNSKMNEWPREKITQEMERLVLLSENLLKKARMREVETLSREIKNRQRRFIDTLKEQKGPLTPEALQGLMKELEKLKELTAKVMEALSQMATQLPDEFVNSPELKGLNLQDLFKDLNDIQQKLMAGDTQGALEAAQRLLQNLSDMMAAMARAGAQARMGSFGRLQSEMTRQSSELEKIVREQKEILVGTESINDDLNQAIETETGNRIDRMMPYLEETLGRLQRFLSSEQQDTLSEMRRQLEGQAMENFSRLAQGMAEELGENPDAGRIVDEMIRMLEGLTPTARDVMTESDRKVFPELSAREQSLYQKTRDLGEKLDVLSQLFPGMDTEIINDIKAAAGSMDTASSELGLQDPSAAIPPEEEAIRRLTRSQQGMQQMAQAMAQQMAMQMRANQWGYPMAYDPRHGGYYGPWGPMPTLPQPEVDQRLEKGYTGIDKEEFDPPDRDAYKTPEILREQVMEALKEDIPPQYQREVQRYFKGLTE